MNVPELERAVAALRGLLNDEDKEMASRELRIVTRNAAAPVLNKFVAEEEDLSPERVDANTEVFATILGLGMAAMIPAQAQRVMGRILLDWGKETDE